MGKGGRDQLAKALKSHTQSIHETFQVIQTQHSIYFRFLIFIWSSSSIPITCMPCWVLLFCDRCWIRTYLLLLRKLIGAKWRKLGTIYQSRQQLVSCFGCCFFVGFLWFVYAFMGFFHFFFLVEYDGVFFNFWTWRRSWEENDSSPEKPLFIVEDVESPISLPSKFLLLRNDISGLFVSCLHS